MATSKADQVGFVLNDRYEFLEKIGPGLYSTVYIVHDRKADNASESKKAIKVIPYLDLSQNLVTEAKILIENQHPNIVKVYDGIYLDGKFYVVMEYCYEHDLEKVIARQKKQGEIFSETQVIKWLIQLLQGLKFIHERGIIHRDIKPRNILVHCDDVKLGDFGVSRVITESSEEADTIVGTTAYMSPEMIRSEGYNQKYDIWSIGCVLYELVAQRRTFMGTNTLDIFYKIVNMELPDWPSHYSVDLQNIFKRTLTSNPADRPTAMDLLKTNLLCRYMDSEGNFDETNIATQHAAYTSAPNVWPKSVGTDEVFVCTNGSLLPRTKQSGSATNTPEKKGLNPVSSASEKGAHLESNDSTIPTFSIQTDGSPPDNSFHFKSDNIPGISRLSLDDFQSPTRPEHVVNFIVRQKQSDPESIYIDCCKKHQTELRLRELAPLSYIVGPLKSKDVVLADKSIVYVTTSGPVQLEIDGTGIDHFELMFDSDLDNAGEEGWLSPFVAENNTSQSQRGFINFSVRKASITPQERRRSESRMGDSNEHVLLCSLPVVLTPNDHPHHRISQQPNANIPQSPPESFWNPVVSMVTALKGDQWVDLARELHYDSANIGRFQNQGDHEEAIANMLLDWFRKRNQHSEKMETLSGALKSIGLNDVADALIEKENQAREDRQFRRMVDDLVDDARLLLEQETFLRLLGLSDADIVEGSTSLPTRSLKGSLRHGVMLWRCRQGSESSVVRVVECLEEMKMLHLAEMIVQRHQGR